MTGWNCHAGVEDRCKVRRPYCASSRTERRYLNPTGLSPTSCPATPSSRSELEKESPQRNRGNLSQATSAPQTQVAPAQSCGSRRDVLIEAKQVSWVVLVLQRDEPLVLLRTVGGADPILLIPHLVVDVDAAG